MSLDADAVTNLIVEVAETEILPRFKCLSEGETWEKRSGAKVTVADERAEAALSKGLSKILPEARVVGEEACEAYPSLLDVLQQPGMVWIIDPVDGTANFADGKSAFAVMVALVKDGETVAGWIYDPVAGAMSSAEQGAGAWRDGVRLRVAKAVPDHEMTGALGWHLQRDTMFNDRFAYVTHHKCCGVDYQALGTGASHFAFYRSLKPWDHAPGQLLHREAGGYNACLDSRPYMPGRKEQEGLLMAPDRDSWQALARDIKTALTNRK